MSMTYLPNYIPRAYLVECLNFRRGAVRELDVGEVPLRARDVLRRRHQVVPRLQCDCVAAFQVPDKDKANVMF